MVLPSVAWPIVQESKEKQHQTRDYKKHVTRSDGRV